MTATVFVDANVFIYAADITAPREKHEAAILWRTELWKSRRGRISFQVLQEFYAKTTQKQPRAREGVRAEVRDLVTWRPILVDAEILKRGWKYQERYQVSFWMR